MKTQNEKATEDYRVERRKELTKGLISLVRNSSKCDKRTSKEIFEDFSEKFNKSNK